MVRTFTTRALTLAAVVVALGFVAATVFSLAALRRIGAESVGLVDNAVPTAHALGAARTALRRLDAALDRALLDEMADRPLDQAAIHLPRIELQIELAIVRALPLYDGEADMIADEEVARRDLERACDRVMDELVADHIEAAHQRENGEWRVASDRLDDEMSAHLLFDIAHANAHSRNIESVARGTIGATLLFGALDLLMSVAAVLLAGRVLRRAYLRETERRAELELFSSRVAHDLLSPLSAVRLTLDRLDRAPDLSGDAVRRLTRMSLSALGRVQRVVGSLLAFARSGARPPVGAQCAIGDVLPDLLDELRPQAEEARVELLVTALPSLRVAAEAGVLEVLLTNLVRNAIKFMGDDRFERIVRLRVVEGRNVARFEVEDTGPGLPPGFEEAAFEAYRRGSTNAPGLGLGLATVKRLAEAHGGRCGVRSLKTGALVWFELPLADQLQATGVTS